MMKYLEIDSKNIQIYKYLLKNVLRKLKYKKLIINFLDVLIRPLNHF